MLDDRGCMTLGTPPANGFRVGWPGEIASLDKETLVSDLRYGRHPISGNSFNEKDPVLPKIIVAFTGPPSLFFEERTQNCLCCQTPFVGKFTKTHQDENPQK